MRRAAQPVTAYEGARLIVGDARVIENATLLVDGAIVWSEGLGASETALSQIMLVIFLAVLALMAYRYFRENQLKWLVIKPWLRGVIIACVLPFTRRMRKFAVCKESAAWPAKRHRDSGL